MSLSWVMAPSVEGVMVLYAFAVTEGALRTYKHHFLTAGLLLLLYVRYREVEDSRGIASQCP